MSGGFTPRCRGAGRTARRHSASTLWTRSRATPPAASSATTSRWSPSGGSRDGVERRRLGDFDLLCATSSLLHWKGLLSLGGKNDERDNHTAANIATSQGRGRAKDEAAAAL